MQKLLMSMIIVLMGSCPLAADTNVSFAFPVPAGLEANVQFWKRVYCEWTTEQIAFTDNEDLGIVYRVIDVPPMTHPFFRRLREEKIQNAKEEIRNALTELEAIRPHAQEEVNGLSREIFLALKDIKRSDKYRRIDFIRGQNGLKNRFEEGYYLSGAHIDEMRLRFREAGLPEELVAIVFVESLFHPRAISSAGAAGLWQFLRGTAKEYMSVNNLVDERFDPILATEAAILYLKSARDKLVQWPLVITSYNYGRAGMMRAMNTVNSSDFGDILKKYEHDRFGFASRNYYSEFLAALDVLRDAKKIFPNIEPKKPWDYDVLTLKTPVFLSSVKKSDSALFDSFKELNPAIGKEAESGKEALPTGFSLRLPTSKKVALKKIIMSSASAEETYASNRIRARHKADGRQTLEQIAKMYDIFKDQLAERIGFAPTYKLKKGSVVLIRSIDSRFTEIPEPLFRPGKPGASS